MQVWQMKAAQARLHELAQRASETLIEFMQRSPLKGLDDLVFERDPSPGRNANGDDATSFFVGD